MTISQLKQVIEVAKVGSISQAAANLFMTQPNLSQSLRKLEAEIGIEIFQRTNNGVGLTAFGRRFVSGASATIIQFEHLHNLCEANLRLQPMELSVFSGGFYFVTKQLALLAQKYSSNPITIRHYESAGGNIYEQISKGDAELGFSALWEDARRTIMSTLKSMGLEYHRLADAVPCIYVNRANPHFTDNDTVVDLEKLRNLPYIATQAGQPFCSNMFKTLFPGENLSTLYCATRSIHVGNAGTMRDLLALTDGFAIGAYCATIYERGNFYPDLRMIPFAPGLLQCEVGWYQKSNTLRSPLAEELINDLRNVLI